MRKCFALLLALCLALTCVSACAESIYATNIGPIEKTFTRRPVATEEEAIAYANEIWQSDWFAQDTAGFSWWVGQEIVWGEPEWTVLGTLDTGDDEFYFTLSFLAKDGTLVRAENGLALAALTDVEDDGSTDVITATVPDDLIAYLKAFAAAGAEGYQDNNYIYPFAFSVENLPEFAVTLGDGFDFDYSVVLELAPVTRVVDLIRGWG